MLYGLFNNWIFHLIYRWMPWKWTSFRFFNSSSYEYKPNKSKKKHTPEQWIGVIIAYYLPIRWYMSSKVLNKQFQCSLHSNWLNFSTCWQFALKHSSTQFYSIPYICNEDCCSFWRLSVKMLCISFLLWYAFMI